MRLARGSTRVAALVLVLAGAAAGGPSSSGGAPSPGGAPSRGEGTAAEALAKVRSAVALTEGRLAGPGADLLREAGGGAQYVLLGEDHGIREIAEFGAAYFEELTKHGFRTLAIECGPVLAAELVAHMQQGDPLAGALLFIKANPLSIPYFDLKEEADGLGRMVRAAGSDFALWGFDQELIGATRFLLQEIARHPLGDEAKALVADLFAKDEIAFRDAAQTGRPDRMYMLSADEADLEALRKLLAAPKDRRALRLLDSLVESRSIYAKHFAGEEQESSLQRSRLMKKKLAPQLFGAPGRKVVFKTGALHAYAGVNPLGIRDVGNFVAEHAEGRGLRSLHILAFAPQGEQARFAGVGTPMTAMPIEPIDRRSPLSGLLPLIEAAKDVEGWSLFDLRPLRSQAGSIAAGDAKLERLLHGFDFVLLIPKGTASHEEV